MADCLQIYFDKDGTARIYDDTYDITIHCESQEEADEAARILKRASEMRWRPVAEEVPKLSKTEVESVDVLGWIDSGEICVVSYTNENWFWAGKLAEEKWICPQFSKVIAWMPLPAPYKEEGEPDV